MADEVEDDLVLTPPEGMEDEEPETPNGEEEGDGEDEFTIELDGEEQVEDTPLIKQLREQIRERDKRLATYQKSEAAKIEVGPKPTLESCDYDEERYETELDAWKDRSAKAANAEAEAARTQEIREQEQQQRVINYRAKAAALPVKDFDAAEATVVAALPELHQSALLAYVDDPAKLVYALAKHPQMLDKLASEPDVIKALKMAWRMEGSLKVTTRKKPPSPESETIQRGSVALTQKTDREEDRLRTQAEKTGDYSALTAYKAGKKRQPDGY